jgi:hypothetical protein
MRFLTLPAALIAVGQLALASTPAPAQGAVAQPAPRGTRAPPASSRALRTAPTQPGCDFATMPRLPADADRTPAARAGFEWTPGHYTCARTGWSWRAGQWRRAGSPVDASALVVARNGGLAPRAGYQFVRQGNGVTVARMAGGGRITTAGVAGNFSCVCASEGGGCGITTTSRQITCESDGCMSCRISFVVTGVAGVAISRRDELPVFMTTDCGRGARLAGAAP